MNRQKSRSRKRMYEIDRAGGRAGGRYESGNLLHALAAANASYSFCIENEMDLHILALHTFGMGQQHSCFCADCQISFISASFWLQ